MLRNHGLLTTGPSAAEAFNGIYWLEMAGRAQVDATAARAELTVPDARTVDHAVHRYRPGTRRPFGVLEWPPMLRLLDRQDPGWRDWRGPASTRKDHTHAAIPHDLAPERPEAGRLGRGTGEQPHGLGC